MIKPVIDSVLLGQISQATKVMFGLLDNEEESTFTRNDAMPFGVKMVE